MLDRLVFQKHYGLAIQIAKHLKLSEARILEHWAFHKVAHDKSERGRHEISEVLFSFCLFSDDDEVARKISDKLRSANVQGISFCNIAKKAQELGRKKLAIKVKKEYL